MQKGGPVKTDVDEGRLHAWQHARHLAEVDVAGQPAGDFALEVKLLHRALLNQRDANFERGNVDEDLFGHGWQWSGRIVARGAHRFREETMTGA